MGDSFQITIMGQTYLLKGTHDKEYVGRVENFLNEQISRFAVQAPQQTPST